MSETEPTPPPGRPLPVLPNSGKVDQLRADPPAPKHVDTTLVSRFLDPNKTAQQKKIEEKVIAAIRTVYDPEIPVNVYDLGLIYAIDVDAETSKVRVKMTLTAPGCPVAGSLPIEVEKRIEAIPEVPSAVVELVWEPAWDKTKMSEAALLELGLI